LSNLHALLLHSRDRRRWETKEKWRRRRDEEAGGCIRQQVADALWELSGRFDVGMWYEYVRVGMWVNQYDVFCGVVVGGVRLDQPYCRTVDECVRQILEDYRNEVKRRSEPPPPPPPDPAEELLKEWLELKAFGVDWVRKWLNLRERLVEIAKVLRKFPWMAEVIKQRPMSLLHPYAVVVYVARDGSDVCLSLTSSMAYCAQDGAVKEVKQSRSLSDTRHTKMKIREVYRLKGLLAFTTAAKEYVRLL
jgi:hypothetical protein